MNALNVVMIGGSGAVGSLVVHELVKSDRVKQITLLNRRKVSLPQSSKIKEYVVDIFDSKSYEHFLPHHDVAISTLGIGQPSKVSKEEYFRVDVDCARNFAEACKKNGIKKISALTAIGANAKSSIYYLRGKGELEEAIANLGFASAAFFEPSTIITPQNRYGLSQGFILAVQPKIDFLLVGPLAKYRSIAVADLARAITLECIAETSGVRHYRWQEIVKSLA